MEESSIVKFTNTSIVFLINSYFMYIILGFLLGKAWKSWKILKSQPTFSDVLCNLADLVGSGIVGWNEFMIYL